MKPTAEHHVSGVDRSLWKSILFSQTQHLVSIQANVGLNNNILIRRDSRRVETDQMQAKVQARKEQERDQRRRRRKEQERQHSLAQRKEQERDLRRRQHKSLRDIADRVASGDTWQSIVGVVPPWRRVRRT